MNSSEGYWDEGMAIFDSSRFLEYSDEEIVQRFGSLDERAIAELKSLPTLFAYEAQVEQPARVGWITDIQQRQKQIRVTFEFDPAIESIQVDSFRKILWDLDIDQKFEVNRTHWAVKNVDLFGVLRRFGLLGRNPKGDLKAVKFSRQTIMRACDLLRSRLGHADFDRLLLEIGLNHIDAGRSRGSLQARSVALAAYAVEHMDELTAEKEPLALVIVRHAAESDPDYKENEGFPHPIQSGFWSSLRKDGVAFSGGRLESASPEVSDARRLVPPYATGSGVPLAEPISVPKNIEVGMVKKKGKVFIVHGRDQAPKHDVARFLERIGIEAVILHERPSGGRTLITKFQEESSDIEFAVVLMTADDVGGLAGTEQRPRARQNVIFELGFFIGKLGSGRVCALVQGDVEKPSDFESVVYIPYNDGGGWKVDLARELSHAGVSFESSRVFT